MRINNNMMAMNTHRQLGVANEGGAKSMEKLSSGMRINRAGDDAAGLAISEKMRGQIRGLNQASSNAQDGISLIQTAEGALNETHAILQRMRELAVQSSTDTNTDSDRGEIQKEIDQLSSEITRIADNTEFNTKNLLNGNLDEASGEKLTFHIGANKGQNVELNIENMGAEGLKVIREAVTAEDVVASEGTLEGINITNTKGENVKVSIVASEVGTADLGNLEGDAENGYTIQLGATTTNNTLDAIKDKINAHADFTAEIAEGIDKTAEHAGAVSTTLSGGLAEAGEDPTKGINVSTQEKADGAIKTINDALENVSAERSKLGAMQNRLEHTIKNLDTSSENLQASEARIRDVDMAKEMMEQTKQNILAQASTAMLANANQSPQSVLQLLG